MAPLKRANKGSSVSFDETRFRSKTAKDKFNDTYANRPLRHEKVVRLSDFTDSPVPGWFDRRGWMPMLIATGDVCIDLVREFYVNLLPTPNDDSTFTSYVRGHEIYYDSIIFSEFLHIADPVIYDYPPVPTIVNYHTVARTLCGHTRAWIGGNLLQHKLTSDYRLLNLILSSTINPRGHVSDINQERGYEL
ncbi:hypothetical protein U1Q18_014264 [Sarracenia purpurea var. burkii]